ncbi:HAD-like protein, partial [Aspergillus sclerotioniger CBS 115572]
QKHIILDVVGTCISFSTFIRRIETILGPRLRTHHTNAHIFSYAWMQASELEYTMLLMSSRYTPYSEVFKTLFYRVLYMSGIENPREFATEDERDACQAACSLLELRPGCREMMEKLRGNGFEIWCLTTGDVARVSGYFVREGVEMPVERVVSCVDFMEGGGGDRLGVVKPSMGAYRRIVERLGLGEEDEMWFAAAHMWDVSAAVKAGFRGAYCSAYEKESRIEIFDTRMDVMADSLPEMADKIIAMTS